MTRSLLFAVYHRIKSMASPELVNRVARDDDQEAVGSLAASTASLKEVPSSALAEQEHSEVPLVETPSISMSAGADPWADPSPLAAAMASATSRPTRDNPWATNTPDIGKEAMTLPSIEASNQDDRWGELHLPKLGHSLSRYWSFKPGLLQLNNGEQLKGEIFRSAVLTSLFADSRIIWSMPKASNRRIQSSTGSSRGEY